MGAFSVVASPKTSTAAEPPLHHLQDGPSLRLLDASTFAVEFALPDAGRGWVSRGPRRDGDARSDLGGAADGSCHRRVARVEYRADAVGWWRVGTDGEHLEGDVAEPTALTMRVDAPPALTSGRCVLGSNPGGGTASRHTWGTPGHAADFTGGAAAVTPCHMLAFRSPAELRRAVEALLERYPTLGTLKAPRGTPMPPPPAGLVGTRGCVSDRARRRRGRGARRGAGSPPRLGKRGRPDGRVLQPPKKRLAVTGEHDPGFQG